MNKNVVVWFYLILTFSFVYWFIIGGTYMFPNVNPIIISFIAMLILYYLSNQQSLILLI
jgi:hypothetical protein